MRLGSIEAVVVAVQEDANAEIEKIERDVAAAVARLREEDAALPVVVPDAETRLAAARRAVRDRIAGEDWADRLATLSNREAWIARVHDEGERRLAALDPPAVRADLGVFVREAFERMPNTAVELLVPAAHLELAESMWRDGTLVPAGRVIAAVRGTPEVASGCILQTLDGHIRYENTHATRATRLEAVWRAQLGALYEEPAGGALAGSAPERNGA